jgi:hypothetical protein
VYVEDDHPELIMAKDSSLISGVLAQLTIVNLLLGVLAYLAFLVIKQIVYYRFLSPIKDFPGPFWASVTRLWIAWKDRTGNEVKALVAVHKKYGEQITLLAGPAHPRESPRIWD